MPLHNQYALFPESIGGTVLRHVEEASLDPKLEESLIRAAGSTAVQEVFDASQDATLSFKSHDLFALLDTLGINLFSGLIIPTSAPSFFQYRKRADGGFAAAGNHFRVKSVKGFVHFESISATQDDKKLASAALLYHCLADDSGNYLVPLDSQTLAGVPGITSGYTLGPLYIAGTQIVGNTKFQLDTKQSYKTSRHAGEVRAQQGASVEHGHTMTFSSKHLPHFVTYGFGLKHVLNVTQYLQAIDSDGERVAKTTPSHIAITFPLAKLAPNKVSGGQDQTDAMGDFVAHLLGETITVNTATQIP